MADYPYNTVQWRRLRLAHLARHPWCVECLDAGQHVRANTVDHIVPVSQGGHPFPGHDGLTSYCASCHSAKTARGAEAGAVRSRRPRKGCNPDGSPLDRRHPWHEKSLRAAGLRPPSNLNSELVRDGERGVAGLDDGVDDLWV